MPHETAVDPAPLSPAQLSALVASAGRELTWGLRAAAHELRHWRARAETIPTTALREDALRSLAHKRGHAVGAGLFAILPRRRHTALVRALIAYETILDYLDDVSERHPTPANGDQLHLALVDATDPDRPMTDYYAFHPWYDDGGYLAALVLAFRDACRSLPSYANVRAVLVHEARRARVLGLNHEPDPRRRDAALRTWAQDEFHDEFDRHGLSWFELTAAASTSLRVHALLSLATRPRVSDDMVAGTFAAHWPWVSLAATMLDSYVDQHEDRARGNHSYVAHYRDHDTAVARIAESVLRALQGALSAPDGYRHAVIVGCMVALYLSKDSARSPELRASTDVLAASGGSLVRLLLPILRAWRLLNHQRAS